MKRLEKRDLLPSVVLVAAGAYALWEAQSMTTFGAVFPILAASGMVLGGLALALRLALGIPTSHAPEGQFVRPLILLAALTVWAVLLPVTGFIPTSCVAVLVVMAVAQQNQVSVRSHIIQGVSLLALVGVVALVFGTFLRVPLP